MESIVQIILDLILLLLFAGSIVLFVFAQHPEASPPTGLKGVLLLGIVGSGALLLGALSAVIVPAGNVGVVTAFGRVDGETLPPGIHFRLPFVNVVHNITTRVQPHEFKEIDAASAEYQSVKLTGIMNYHIDGQYASDLYQRVGDDFAGKILDPAFNDYIKTVVPTYSITEILGKRDEIRGKAKAALQANLAQYHIVVDDIYIANIGFSDQYSKAIEAKQVAQQQVETEKQVLAQKQIQAQQAIVAAQGQAQATIEAAKGQAQANELLTKSLSPSLIQYTLVQKLGSDIKVIMIPTGQQFLLDTKALTTP